MKKIVIAISFVLATSFLIYFWPKSNGLINCYYENGSFTRDIKPEECSRLKKQLEEFTEARKKREYEERKECYSYKTIGNLPIDCFKILNF